MGKYVIDDNGAQKVVFDSTPGGPPFAVLGEAPADATPHDGPFLILENGEYKHDPSQVGARDAARQAFIDSKKAAADGKRAAALAKMKTRGGDGGPYQ